MSMHTIYSKNNMCQKCKGMGLNGLIPKEFEKNMLKIWKKINLGGNGLDCLSYLAGNSQMSPMILFIFSA